MESDDDTFCQAIQVVEVCRGLCRRWGFAASVSAYDVFDIFNRLVELAIGFCAGQPRTLSVVSLFILPKKMQ